MARLPVRGAAFSSLYEKEITLDQVISELGLDALARKNEWELRVKLGLSIGRWSQTEEQYQFEGGGLDVKAIQAGLSAFAACLKQIDSVLAVSEGGIHHEHDIEVASRLASSLSELPNIGSIEAAYEFLGRFRSDAETVAHSGRISAALLSLEPKKSGRISQDWYDLFVVAVDYLCTIIRFQKGSTTTASPAYPGAAFSRSQLPWNGSFPRRCVRRARKLVPNDFIVVANACSQLVADDDKTLPRPEGFLSM